ncbi:MAG: carbonic anhydrase family protein [Alphaproteobacteria bacterium]
MHRQSPINLDLTNDNTHSHESFVIQWHQFDARLEDTGYLVRAYGDGGHIIFKKQRFDFVEFHFHTPSEHHINNKDYPMEIHFVHYNAELDQFVVLGVLYEATQPSPELQKLIDALPYIDTEHSFTINPELLLPKNITTLHYDGSLTTAPCTENVSWQVFYEPHYAEQKQIDAIRAVRDNNAREIQPLNDRDVTKSG